MPILFYGVTALLLVISIRFNKSDGFMEKNSSSIIKGFFILLIVFSHILDSFPYGGFAAIPLGYFREALGQLIVSMFFFISGYGIIYSIDSKGDSYSKSILTNRFLRIITYTTISVIPFIIYSTCLGKPHPIKDYFLFPIGLASFGNEHWFIFAILFCYLLTGIAYFVPLRNRYVQPIIITIGVVGYIIAFYLFKKNENWWWDTIICFPLGMIIALFKEKINNMLNRKALPWALMITSVVMVGGIHFFESSKSPISIPHIAMMWFSNIFFCLFFICFTKVFTLKSPVLEYLGRASYGIYIMHRFVICCFQDFGTIPNEWLNYFVLFSTSVLIGIPFFYLYKAIDKWITDPVVEWNRNLTKQNFMDGNE